MPAGLTRSEHDAAHTQILIYMLNSILALGVVKRILASREDNHM